MRAKAIRRGNRPAGAPFSHIGPRGNVRMVHVGGKPISRRQATAAGRLICRPSTLDALRARALPKGDALAVAQVAGIQAAKRAADLIPLCHTIAIEQVALDIAPAASAIEIRCTVAATAKTGVEMEALTGVAVAALALYDMCKSADPTLRIEEIRLLSKEKRPIASSPLTKRNRPARD
ncbi:MAG: cyclic pyranopterin monophosphate synthase MoaC [Verrucomicrobia bacterium]|nr:cyclic pyranopterin monophosphate synthase MoaC [Verrucomicrobiota bacterium]